MDESNQSTKRSSDFSSATSQSSPRTSTNNFNVSFSSSVDYAYKRVSPQVAYPAIVFGYRLLEHHTDYVSLLYPKIFAELEKQFRAKTNPNLHAPGPTQGIETLFGQLCNMINVEKSTCTSWSCCAYWLEPAR